MQGMLKKKTVKRIKINDISLENFSLRYIMPLDKTIVRKMAILRLLKLENI